jgi:hypothetical protein
MRGDRITLTVAVVEKRSKASFLGGVGIFWGKGKKGCGGQVGRWVGPKDEGPDDPSTTSDSDSRKVSERGGATMLGLGRLTGGQASKQAANPRKFQAR